MSCLGGDGGRTPPKREMKEEEFKRDRMHMEVEERGLKRYKSKRETEEGGLQR